MPLFASAKARHLGIGSLLVVALAICSAWFIHRYLWQEACDVAVRLWPPPTAGQIEQRHLRKIAGWFSLDCGHVRHREDADAAIACAQGAMKTGRRFYVSFDGIGLDSHFTIGLAADAKGAVYEVLTNQMPGVWGYAENIGTGRTVTVSRCAMGTIEEVSNYPANRYLRCLPVPVE